MTNTNNEYNFELQPGFSKPRQVAELAHRILVKFKEMELPDDFDQQLAVLCTDLSDCRSASKDLENKLKILLNEDHGWDSIGEILVDIRSIIDHLDRHVKSVKKPINMITNFSYSESERKKL